MSPGKLTFFTSFPFAYIERIFRPESACTPRVLDDWQQFMKQFRISCNLDDFADRKCRCYSTLLARTP